MTVTQFDHGYWYATELKHFAKGLGVPSASKLRKDELERAIRVFLRTGAIAQPSKRKLSAPTERDVERGLHLDLLVVGYSNDTETKQFLEREARKLVPGLKRRSGAHHPPRVAPKQDEHLTFTFVTDSVHTAVAQAKAAAREKAVPRYRAPFL